MSRELRLGCKIRHNLEEQEDEQDWLQPCFPRFYLYDVLRGLTFVLKWAEKRRKSLPAEAIGRVVAALVDKSQDGAIRVERHAYEGIGTRILSDKGNWTRRPSATYFPLLMQVSEIGQVSPYLTAKWNECRRLLDKFIAGGRID